MRARWRVFVACTPTSMIQGLDVAMVNLALPSISVRLSADLADLQWVVAAYALALVSLLPTSGALGDMYGRRRVMLVGYGLLMGGAVMAWSATSMAMLLPARVAQGAGMALGFPNSLAMLALAFRPERRGRAVAVWTVISSAVFATGPVVGGALVGAFGFNSIFVPVVALAAAGAAGTWRWLGGDHGRREGTLDVWGIVLGTGAVSLLSYGLIEGGRGGFARPLIVAVLGAGLWCATWFVRHESRVEHAMLDVRLMRKAWLGPVLLVTFVLYAATNAVIFVMAIYLQSMRGLSPWMAGLVMLALSGSGLVGAPLGGYLYDRAGFRKPVLTVLPLLALAALTMGQAGPGAPLAGYVAVGLALVGMLNGYFFVISSASVVSRAPEAQASAASASLPAARQLGGVFGVTMAGALASVVTRARLRSSLPDTGPAAEAISAVSFGVVPDGTDHVVAGAATDAAFFAYTVVMMAVAAAALVGAVTLFVLLVRRRM